jgi:hypothetical protein
MQANEPLPARKQSCTIRGTRFQVVLFPASERILFPVVGIDTAKIRSSKRSAATLIRINRYHCGTSESSDSRNLSGSRTNGGDGLAARYIVPP